MKNSVTRQGTTLVLRNAGLTQQIANAFLVLAQGIAEAARFPHISGSIRDYFNNGASSWEVDDKSLIFENSWSTMGNNLATGLETGHVPEFNQNGVVLQTLSDYGLALAIILYHRNIRSTVSVWYN